MATEIAPPTAPEPITRKNYWDRAKVFIAKTGQEWFPVDLGSDEYRTWCKYFRGHLQWVPRHWTSLEEKQISVFLTPTQWPEFFDSSFVADAYPGAWPPEPEYRPDEYEQARVGPKFVELQKLLGSSLQPMKAPKSKQAIPTDEDLRRIYRKREAAE